MNSIAMHIYEGLHKKLGNAGYRQAFNEIVCNDLAPTATLFSSSIPTTLTLLSSLLIWLQIHCHRLQVVYSLVS